MSVVAWFLIYAFFFQAEDGIRDYKVTGVQTCALPIFMPVTKSVGSSSMTNVCTRPELRWRADWASLSSMSSSMFVSGWRPRSEERRVGKEWSSNVRACHEKRISVRRNNDER